MDVSETEAMESQTGRELERTGYPDDIPPLPPIPVERYTDPAFHDLEMREFWPKTWLHVGHISQLPKAGSYRLFEQLDLSVIIHRGADDTIRAFHNICRHRGAALVNESEGHAPRFICPYHAWGYDDRGALVSVPEARDFACLDKAENGLMEVRCDVLRGMIFINLDGKAPPLAESHAPFAGQVGDFPLEDMQVKGIITAEFDCNWKIAYDNFLEIYHVRTVHAKSVARFLNSSSFSISMYEGGHSRFVTRKREAASFFGTDGRIDDRLGQFFSDYTLALPVFPNTFMPVDPIGFTCQNYWPNGPDKSVMVMYMMGWKAEDGAAEQDGEFWAGMRGQIEGIVNEDREVFLGVQRAMRSGLLPTIQLGCQERAIYWYHQELDRVLGVDNIPQHMRVDPVLAATPAG